MCGIFETTPSVQFLLTAFKKAGVNLHVSSQDSSNKRINIAPTEKILSVFFEQYLFTNKNELGNKIYFEFAADF